MTAKGTGGGDPITILMLHGRGTPGPGLSWPQLVEDALASAAGRRGTAAAHVIAPSYASLTDPSAELVDVVRQTISIPGTPARSRRMAASTADLVHLWSTSRLSEKPAPLLAWGADMVARRMDDFTAYMRNRSTKDAVRRLIATEVPAAGGLVVIGHSMGSLVALDVLHDLDPRINVMGLVTIGSPLAYEPFHSLLEDHVLDEAAWRAEVWINIVDPADNVTGGAGLRTSWRAAKRAIDIGVANSRLAAQEGKSLHSAECYLQQPAFGVALDRILRRPRSSGWDAVTDLMRVRALLEGERQATVKFRARLRSIQISRQRLTAARSRPHQAMSDAPSQVTFVAALAHLAGVNVAFWSGKDRYTAQVRATMRLMVGDLPLRPLIVSVIEATDHYGPLLREAYTEYDMLPVDSALWIDRVGAVFPGLFSGARGTSGALAQSGAETTDDLFFVLLKALVQSRVYREVVGPPWPALSRWIEDLRREMEALDPRSAERGLIEKYLYLASGL